MYKSSGNGPALQETLNVLTLDFRFSQHNLKDTVDKVVLKLTDANIKKNLCKYKNGLLAWLSFMSEVRNFLETVLNTRSVIMAI